MATLPGSLPPLSRSQSPQKTRSEPREVSSLLVPLPDEIVSAPTILHALRHWASAAPATRQHLFLGNGDEPSSETNFGQLYQRVRAMGSALSEQIARGERVLLLFGPGPEFFSAFYACLAAGLRPVPLPPPGRPKRDLAKLLAVVESSGARTALSTQAIARRLESEYRDLGVRTLVHEELSLHDPNAWQPDPLGVEDVAYLQYTSGSTSAPKGVQVSHANVMANVRWIVPKYGHALRGAATGTWLPCYHDMGLVGDRITPIYAGIPVYELPAIDFIKRPIRWLRMITRYRVTVAGAPNFAYQTCVSRITDAECEGLDLGSWRVAYNGAEPVRPETLRAFQAKFEPYGLRKTALHPCYGLAEATLFVTTNDVEEAHVIRSFPTAMLRSSGPVFADAAELSQDARTELVGCGRSPEGGHILIVDPERHEEVSPGGIGEIWLSSASVAHGYHERPRETRETFEARLRSRPGLGPFLRTGDLGFFLDGQLYVSGRLKEVLKVRGRNIYPNDVEWTAESSHPSLQESGCCAIALETQQEETILIVAELSQKAYVQERRARDGRGESLDLKAVRRAIQQAVSDEHELFVTVLFVAPGTLPKTSSGKKRRHALRQTFLTNQLEPIS